MINIKKKQELLPSDSPSEKWVNYYNVGVLKYVNNPPPYRCQSVAFYGFAPTTTFLPFNCQYSFLKNIDISQYINLTTIENNAFEGCEKLTSISLPDSLTNIGEYAFYKCKKLASISLPDSITTIGYMAFGECTSLVSISLPGANIAGDAFYKCTNLTTATFNGTPNNINNFIFYQCTNLTTVTFNGTPNSIASQAFQSCTNLTTINVPWSEGAVANAPWGATNATINYNYVQEG